MPASNVSERAARAQPPVAPKKAIVLLFDIVFFGWLRERVRAWSDCAVGWKLEGIGLVFARLVFWKANCVPS